MTAERLLFWALAAVVVAAPLAIGGVHPPVQLALLAAVLSLAAGYAVVTRGSEPSVVPLALPMFAAVVVTLLQVVPLPSGLVHVLSPAAWELRKETGAGSWMPLSVDVPATCLALVRGMACLALFVVTTRFARRRENARRVVAAIALGGAAVAVITLVQRAVGAHAILGFYVPRSMPGSGFWGPFVDGNHAASLAALAGLAAAGLAVELEGGRRFAMIICAALSVVVVLYTASRAGAAGLAIGGFALLAHGLVRRFGPLTGLITAAALLLFATSATLWAADGLRTRLATPTLSGLVYNQKTRGWHDALVMTAAYRWTGVGRGAFEAPINAVRADDEGVRLVYPENLLLQIVSEWGVPVTLALLLWAAIALARLAPRLRRLEASTLGAAAGVLAVVVHEMADFGLEMLGVALPTVVALGVVVGRCERHAERNNRRRARMPVVVASVIAGGWVVLGLGVWAAHHTLDVDFARAKQDSSTVAAATARHPADDHLELIAATEALRGGEPTALAHLNRALRLHPANWQAHYLASRTLLGFKRPSQAALEYRSAIERGMPPDFAEMAALFGRHIVDGAPQRPRDLENLAHWLAGHGRAALADEACLRAVDLSDDINAELRARTAIATEGHDPALMAAAAEALLAGQPDAEGIALAARTLQTAGRGAEADEALVSGVKSHPGANGLVLLGAELRFERGDQAGARGLLRASGDAGFTLAEHQQAEELLAQIAEKSGDVDGAVLARTRARLYARKLKDSGDGSGYTARP